MKKVLWALLAVVLMVNAAYAEDPAPYRGIDFSWEYCVIVPLPGVKMFVAFPGAGK